MRDWARELVIVVLCCLAAVLLIALVARFLTEWTGATSRQEPYKKGLGK